MKYSKSPLRAAVCASPERRSCCCPFTTTFNIRKLKIKKIFKHNGNLLLLLLVIIIIFSRLFFLCVPFFCRVSEVFFLQRKKIMRELQKKHEGGECIYHRCFDTLSLSLSLSLFMMRRIHQFGTSFFITATSLSSFLSFLPSLSLERI